MKVLEFTYTKANGDTSNRVVVEVVKPSAHIAGYDISEMEPEVMVQFAKEYNELEDKIAAMRLALQSQYDLKHNFRMFAPANMTNTTYEFI